MFNFRSHHLSAKRSPRNLNVGVPGLDVYGGAIQGRRSHQEDTFRVALLGSRGVTLIGVADGMGGHSSGMIASRIAIDSTFDGCEQLEFLASPSETTMLSAIQHANRHIAEYQLVHPESRGLGTTMLLGAILDGKLFWASVGDSPLWLWRNGKLARLNGDHSYRGLLPSCREAFGNQLRSALTGGHIALTDVSPTPLAVCESDTLCFASDGMLTLSQKEMEGILATTSSFTAEKAALSLLEAVECKMKDNQDNCTVVIAKMKKYHMQEKQFDTIEFRHNSITHYTPTELIYASRQSCRGVQPINPPPQKWSDLKYVLWHQGGSEHAKEEAYA